MAYRGQVVLASTQGHLSTAQADASGVALVGQHSCETSWVARLQKWAAVESSEIDGNGVKYSEIVRNLDSAQLRHNDSLTGPSLAWAWTNVTASLFFIRETGVRALRAEGSCCVHCCFSSLLFRHCLIVLSSGGRWQ